MTAAQDTVFSWLLLAVGMPESAERAAHYQKGRAFVRLDSLGVIWRF